MTESRTIDNLGFEASVRWATDQEFLDKTLLKDSPFIPKETQVDVYTPFYTSQFDAIFQLQNRHQQWALFAPPLGYHTQKMRLFTHQIIPSLGTEQLQQNQIQKIQKRKKRDKKKQKTVHQWQEEREEQEEIRESKALINLLEYLATLDQLLATINARRSQYSKG